MEFDYGLYKVQIANEYGKWSKGDLDGELRRLQGEIDLFVELLGEGNRHRENLLYIQFQVVAELFGCE